MKTFRVYLKCYVDVQAKSKQEAEDMAEEMDYSFSHDGEELNSELYEVEEIVKQNLG